MVVEATHSPVTPAQADILKEDQGQNTCIFSTDFAIKMMGDIQALRSPLSYFPSFPFLFASSVASLGKPNCSLKVNCLSR